MEEDSLRQTLANLGLNTTTIANRNVVSWRYWGVYLHPGLVRILVDRMIQLLPDAYTDADYLCPVPRSGLALGGYLQAALSKPMVTFYWQHHVLHGDPHIKPDAKVILIDTNVNAGETLERASARLSRVGAEVLCAVVWVLNDTYPPEIEYPMKRDFLTEGKLHYLYTVSDLYPHWTDRGQPPVAVLRTLP